MHNTQLEEILNLKVKNHLPLESDPIEPITRPATPPVFVREQYLITEVTVNLDGTWVSAEQAQVGLEETYGPEFFVITAWNPWCQASTDEENLINNVTLAVQLELAGYKYLKAVGKGRIGNWPAEESFAVWGIKEKEIKRLARDFSQEAIFIISSDLQSITSTEKSDCWIRSMSHDEGESRRATICRSLRDTLIEDGGFDANSLQLSTKKGFWQYLHDFSDEISGQTFSLAHCHLSDIPDRRFALIERELQAEIDFSDCSDWLLTRANIEYELAQARQDAIDRSQSEGKFQVYVIEFEGKLPKALPSQRCVYVGETSKTPELRFGQHKDPESFLSNSYVLEYACNLNPSLYRALPRPRTRRESRALEAKTAELLRRKGFFVIGGH
jgi:hypothetical protein